jgi:Fe-S cluster assembly protein SufD
VIASSPQTFSEESLSSFLASRDEPSWLVDRRKAALAQFQAAAWPTLRDEEWRRTDIRALKLASFAPPENSAPNGEARAALQPVWDALSEHYATGVEQVDGAVTRGEDASKLPEGVIFTDLAAAAKQHPELIRQYLLTRAVDPGVDAFSALHAAFWTGGAFLYVPKGVKVDVPVFSLIGMS